MKHHVLPENPALTARLTPGAGSPPPLGSGPATPTVFSFPDKGTRVIFRRSLTHEPETGIVRAHETYTGHIHITDMRGKPLRLCTQQWWPDPDTRCGLIRTDAQRAVRSRLRHSPKHERRASFDLLRQGENLDHATMAPAMVSAVLNEIANGRQGIQ